MEFKPWLNILTEAQGDQSTIFSIHLGLQLASWTGRTTNYADSRKKYNIYIQREDSEIMEIFYNKYEKTLCGRNNIHKMQMTIDPKSQINKWTGQK